MADRSRYVAAFVMLITTAACTPSGTDAATPQPTPPRAGRFGSLRDFYWVERSDLFVDRFEVTRGDWREFERTAIGARVDADTAEMAGDAALPVGRVSLLQARAFAGWRFARLPSRDEWLAVATGNGRYRFPWGMKVDVTRANTADLGLGQPTPVGTFESGRSAHGQPYDLIGNVSEWTETVPLWWFRPSYGNDPPPLEYLDGVRDVLGCSAIAIWQPIPGIVPPSLVIAARPERVPHEVVGADYQRSMARHASVGVPERDRPADHELVEYVFAADQRLRTGIRLVCTPAGLLRALVADPVAPTADDYEQLRRFVARSRHRRALRAAWPTVLAAADATQREQPLTRFLRQQLGG